MGFRRRTHPVLAILGFLVGAMAAMLGNGELLESPQSARFSWRSPAITRPAEVGTQKQYVEVTPDPLAMEKALTDQVPDAYPQRLLTLHSHGEDVRLVQQRLRELGFFLEEITGYYDESTRAAVMAFQKSRGLDTDGSIGPKTYSALGI